MTVEQVAERLLVSASKVSRIETGHRAATMRDIRDLCDLYGVADPGLRERMVRLLKEGSRPGWWQEYDLGFATYVGLEADAASISYFQSSIVPGILQTPAYARAVYEGDIEDYTPERIDEHIEVRMRRQALLARDPPLRIAVVLDEAVLHREVGGPVVMGAQLDRLVEVGGLPNVTIQVMDYKAGAHPAMDSNFNIIEYGNVAPAVVYVEGLMGWIYLERPQDIIRHKNVFEHLCAKALNPQESMELITAIRARHSRSEVLAAGDIPQCNA